MTPVLAAQLDDPYCLRQMHTWLGSWHARAASLATSREEHLRRTGAREAAAATPPRGPSPAGRTQGSRWSTAW